MSEETKQRPRLYRHLLSSGAQAQSLAVEAGLDPASTDLLTTVCLVHDLGKLPAWQRSGFHPLDGALGLVEHGAEDIAPYVAWHSAAHLYPEVNLYAAELSVFARPQDMIADMQLMVDLTVSATGRIVTVVERIADVRARYAAGSPEIEGLEAVLEAFSEATARILPELPSSSGWHERCLRRRSAI